MKILPHAGDQAHAGVEACDHKNGRNEHKARPAEQLLCQSCLLYTSAGETAHKRLTPLDGNSTYRNYIIDAIYNMTPDQLEEGANYEVR